MYSFDIDASSKTALYADLLSAIDAITNDEPDAIANMANVAALIWEAVPDLNWARFRARRRASAFQLERGSVVLRPRAKRPNLSGMFMLFQVILPVTRRPNLNWSCRSYSKVG